MVKINPVLAVSHLFGQFPERFVSKFDRLEMKNIETPPLVQKELIFHSSLALVDDIFWENLCKNDFISFVRENFLKRISFDIGPCFQKYKIVNNQYIGVGARLTKEEIENICGRNIDYLRNNLPDSCEIAVENLNYYNTGAYEDVCLPEFYNNFCKKFGLALILDVPHAQVSAWNFDESLREYLKRFDSSLFCECHISKMGLTAMGQAVDLHDMPDIDEFDIIYNIAANVDCCLDIVIEFYRDHMEVMNSYFQMEQYFREKNQNYTKDGCKK